LEKDVVVGIVFFSVVTQGVSPIDEVRHAGKTYGRWGTRRLSHHLDSEKIISKSDKPNNNHNIFVSSWQLSRPILIIINRQQ
jgi:hypothetical protein